MDALAVNVGSVGDSIPLTTVSSSAIFLKIYQSLKSFLITVVAFSEDLFVVFMKRTKYFIIRNHLTALVN